IVMEKGRVALDGTPTEVFRQAEQLKSMGLGVPQVTDLMRELQRRGMEVDSDIFRVEDAEREIMRVLGERI
ncbi:MAG: energy-coupling factor transporter ATPase, partial [Limnochordia bacterium]